MGSRDPPKEPSTTDGLQPGAERIRGHEVRKRALTIDLDDRQELAVARLELRIASDVHEIELELEVGTSLAHDFERTLAEVAARRVVERDPAQRCYG